MNVFRPMCCNWYTFIESHFRRIIFSANMPSIVIPWSLADGRRQKLLFKPCHAIEAGRFVEIFRQQKELRFYDWIYWINRYVKMPKLQNWYFSGMSLPIETTRGWSPLMRFPLAFSLQLMISLSLFGAWSQKRYSLICHSYKIFSR